MNLSSTIIPKSDQLNADDLLTGPRTIKITSVEQGSAEQPVSIHYEGENGRPYKPGKSMRRVLVAMWGSEGAAYVGRCLTLYCDPDITFGPDKTGGIRISHATDITGPVNIALTVKRGKRKPFTVSPLVAKASEASLGELPAAWGTWSIEERGENRATKGVAALQAWWATLPSSDQKRLATKKENEWKPIAANVKSQDSTQENLPV